MIRHMTLIYHLGEWRNLSICGHMPVAEAITLTKYAHQLFPYISLSPHN